MESCKQVAGKRPQQSPVGHSPIGDQKPKEIDARRLAQPAFVAKPEFCDFVVVQQAHDQIDLGGFQRRNFVLQPIARARAWHDRQPPG